MILNLENFIEKHVSQTITAQDMRDAYWQYRDLSPSDLRFHQRQQRERAMKPGYHVHKAAAHCLVLAGLLGEL